MKREITKNKKSLYKQNVDFNGDNEILRVKKKYSFKYIMACKLMELSVIFALFFVVFILRKEFLTVFLLIFVYLMIVVISLILYKKSAESTFISFRDNRVIYRRKFLFIDRTVEIKYSDIKTIAFSYEPGIYAKFWQKRYNLGNLLIYPEKGNIFMNGVQIINVAPLDKIIEEIKNNIGDKLNNG